MNLSVPHIHAFLARFHQDQRGTSLTEFVIALPIYLAIMIGMLNLYQLHQGAIYSAQRSNAIMWRNAIPVQQSPFTGQVLPASGGVFTIANYVEAKKLPGFYAGIDSGAAFGGLYTDSWMKAGAMDLIPNVNVDPEPKLRLSGIVCNPSHAHQLMNDQIDFRNMSFGSFGNFASSLMNMTGSRPSIAAGIRYGSISGTDEHTFGPADGRFQATTLNNWMVSAPVMPSDHFIGAVLTRLEMGNEDWSSVVRFGWSNLGSGMSGVGACP